VQNLRWHADHRYAAQPTKAAALLAVDVPASGGDTLFANMWASGTVGMWDSRCVLHSPIGDHIGRRAMRRLAIGEVAAPLPFRQAA
jgi:alpha-ketoglutarate-dependent taurine dioxygenase